MTNESLSRVMSHEKPSIHPTADVSPKAVIGPGTRIWHQAQVRERVRLGSNCIIGMGAMLLDNAEIGEYCIVAAGAVVTEGQIVPSKSLVMGVPGKVVRDLGESDIQRIEKAARDYHRLSQEHYRGKHKLFFG